MSLEQLNQVASKDHIIHKLYPSFAMKFRSTFLLSQELHDMLPNTPTHIYLLVSPRLVGGLVRYVYGSK